MPNPIAQRLSEHLRTLIVAIATVAVLVLMAVTQLPGDARAETGSEGQSPFAIYVPKPGGLTIGFSGFSEPQSFVDAVPFRVLSISVFDNATQRFYVYIPGAPERVNTLTRENFSSQSIVFIRRHSADVGGAPAGTTFVPEPFAAQVARSAAAPARQPGSPSEAAPAGGGGGGGAPRPPAGPPASSSPTATATTTPTATATPKPSPTATATATPKPSPTATPTATATPKPSPTPTATTVPVPTPTQAPSSSGCQAIPAVNLSILSERAGFGADVDGGADGCLYVVTNDKDSGPGSLREGATQGDRWIVFADDFHIRLNSRVEIASNTTIDGRGHSVTISGGTLRLTGKGKQNLILHNLSLRDSVAGDDLIRIGDGASHFWLHHLTLSNSTDEYIDITRAGSGGLQGTISWSRFNPGTTYTDEFAIIVGDKGGAATNHLINVTFHHNWYNKTRQRHPLITGAYVHSYNNYVQWRLWGIHAREGTQLVSEHDVFDAAYAPSNNDDDAVKVEGTGNFVRVVNPVLLNNASVQTENPDKAFKPSSRYSYSLDPTSSVIASVTAGAGNTR